MSDVAISLNRQVHAALPKDAIDAHVAVDFLLHHLQAQEQQADAAYKERNQVVAALARCFPSGIAQTPIEGWAPEWWNCVYIDLPTGQASWHFHTREAHLFAGFPNYTGQWDRHTTEEKYERLARLTATPNAERPSTAAPVCSCPSGNGSLRWPCPAHPPQAAPQAQPVSDDVQLKGKEPAEQGGRYNRPEDQIVYTALMAASSVNAPPTLAAQMVVDALAASQAQPVEAEQAPAVAQSIATLDVLAERQRQIEREGYTRQFDADMHDSNDLARAAAFYAMAEVGYEYGRVAWPWDEEGCKVKDRYRNFVRAAALLIAAADVERARSGVSDVPVQKTGEQP